MLYYFDVFDGHEFMSADQAHEFKTPHGVRNEAIRVLRDIAGDEMPDSGGPKEFWVKVKDHEGRYVFEASLSLQTKWLVQSDNDSIKDGRRTG